MRPHLMLSRSLAVTLLAGLAPAAMAQYSADPASPLILTSSPGEDVQPKVLPVPATASTGAGGVWLSWFTAPGYSVWLQRLDAQGNRMIQGDGVQVAQLTLSSTTDYGLAVDADGNAYVAFTDTRFTPGNQISVAKVTPSGQLAWNTNGQGGVTLTAGTTSKNSPKVAVLSGGGLAVGWSQSPGVVLQRVNANGTLSGASVTVSESGRTISLSDLATSLDDSFIALWIRPDTTSFLSAKSLVAQRFSGINAPLWSAPSGAPGTAVSNAGTPPVIYATGALSADGQNRSVQNGYFPSLRSDGAGGAMVFWYDNGAARNAWVQHVQADGRLVFQQNGFAAVDPSQAGQLRLSASGYRHASGDYIMAFTTANTLQSQFGVGAQRITPAGQRLFGPLGSEVLGLSGNQPSFLQVAPFPSEQGSALVWLSTVATATPVALFAARVSDTGQLVWPVTPTTVGPAGTGKARLALAATSQSVPVFAWSEGASGAANIAASNLNLDGSVGPPPRSACLADLTGIGGPPSTPDGLLTGDDFNAFIAAFAAGELLADLTGIGGPPSPPDTLITGDDFNAFIAAFAAGCP